MHDTFLLNKISNMLHTICIEKRIAKVKCLKVIVSQNSHINIENLREHIKIHNNKLLDKDFSIEIRKEDIEEQTAIIETIQGENVGG